MHEIDVSLTDEQMQLAQEIAMQRGLPLKEAATQVFAEMLQRQFGPPRPSQAKVLAFKKSEYRKCTD